MSNPIQSPRRAPLALGLVALIWTAGCGRGVPAGPNVLLITVDTLRADYLEPYGSAPPSSPALAEFAAGATVFDEAWSTCSWTLPSLASLHTGLHSSAHGCWQFDSRLDWRADTLAERFAAGGWDTAGIVNHVFLGRKHGLNQGFVNYDDELVKDFGPSHQAVTSETVSDRGVEFIEAKATADDGRPWFLWLHYFDPHAAFKFHPAQSPAFGTEEDQDLYRGEIAFTDFHIGRVLDALAEQGLDSDTVVVVIADHGEEWNEHGRRGHGHNLHRETLRVPLIVRVPGAEPRRVATRVSNVDVAPTLLELAGLEDLPGGSGRSLVPLLEGEALEDVPALAELGRRGPERQTSLGSGQWKLILHEPEGRAELYDVQADPDESRDLAAERPRIVEQLTAELRARREAAIVSAPLDLEASESVQLGGAERAGLEALGYVEGE
ncbi:sulfatase [Engelhardtia mirabilis]|uniref:Choline-sulfatase n=1 Tax=Engelhardtia mirabilis TaxID=2528011 RepID=A0A518BQN9_9BACT|nr:Choline-sulfatase [Planctomycetes bacterium Pla133]QDV03587.1 Choline-sulfatase [Planctomycetes bacterium Pla86]